ncbi:tetratricopeptide repeat protein [Candidatus Sumerlaeota bacterium]|nr:tetratricopeptide repeat protein [Candidatus Sumerlaeota bacterium]
MRRLTWAIMLALCFFGRLGGAIPLDGDWFDDWDRAQFLAQKQERPIVLAFVADWNSNSQLMERNVLAGDEFRRTFQDWTRVKLDASAHGDVARKFGVCAIPTVIFLNSAGTELERAEGYMPLADFLMRYDAAMSGEENLPARIERAMAGDAEQDEARELVGLLLRRNAADAGLRLTERLAEQAAEFDFVWRGELGFYRAEFYSRGGELEQARDALREFLEEFSLHEQAPAALLKLAQTELALDDYAAARKALERFIADYPDHPLAPAAENMLNVTLQEQERGI